MTLTKERILRLKKLAQSRREMNLMLGNEPFPVSVPADELAEICKKALAAEKLVEALEYSDKTLKIIHYQSSVDNLVSEEMRNSFYQIYRIVENGFKETTNALKQYREEVGE